MVRNLGVSHFTVPDDDAAIQMARDLCDLLPQNNLEHVLK